MEVGEKKRIIFDFAHAVGLVRVPNLAAVVRALARARLPRQLPTAVPTALAARCHRPTATVRRFSGDLLLSRSHTLQRNVVWSTAC